jgi:hypothetical protein
LPGIALVATATETEAIRLDTGERTVLSGAFARFAADMSRAAVVGDRYVSYREDSGALTVYDEHGEAIGTFASSSSAGAPTAIAISSDGSLVALSYTLGGRVQLFDVKTRREFGESFAVPTGSFNEIGFARGSHVVVVHWPFPSTIVTINADPRWLRAYVCSVASRDLTDSEWRAAGQAGPAPRVCG